MQSRILKNEFWGGIQWHRKLKPAVKSYVSLDNKTLRNVTRMDREINKFTMVERYNKSMHNFGYKTRR
jgi:hypothetical protein